MTVSNSFPWIMGLWQENRLHVCIFHWENQQCVLPKAVRAYHRLSLLLEWEGSCHSFICQHRWEECCFRFQTEAYSLKKKKKKRVQTLTSVGAILFYPNTAYFPLRSSQQTHLVSDLPMKWTLVEIRRQAAFIFSICPSISSPMQTPTSVWQCNHGAGQRFMGPSLITFSTAWPL